MNKLTALQSSCCNSSTFRSFSCFIHRRNTNDVQCENTKVTDVVLDWIEREICIDVVAWLSNQANINLVQVDLSVAMFLRNSGPGNIQTCGTLRGHPNLTRCNKGNWKIGEKVLLLNLFPWRYWLAIYWTHFFIPERVTWDISKIAKNQVFCQSNSWDNTKHQPRISGFPLDCWTAVKVTSSTRSFGLSCKNVGSDQFPLKV